MNAAAKPCKPLCPRGDPFRRATMVFDLRDRSALLRRLSGKASEKAVLEWACGAAHGAIGALQALER